jgi:hypothetical protein
VRDERYARHRRLAQFGSLGQERLDKGAVRVVGSGAAAEEAALYLVAAGVGRVSLEAALMERLFERLAALNPEVVLGAPSLGALEVRAEGGRRAEGAKAALDAILALAGLRSEAPWSGWR